jgi:hypothetical protein
MVVVALLSVIVLGLMAMFNQTQRAFRLGMSQTDVLESGRMATEMISRELGQITPCKLDRTNFAPNFAVQVMNVTWQALPGAGDRRTNILQDVFFLSRQNQTWTGIGYFVRTNLPGNSSVPGGVGPIGTLYRFETNMTAFQFDRNPAGLVAGFNAVVNQLASNNVSKVLDGVVHFRIRPYDPAGWVIPFNPSWSTTVPTCMTNGNMVVTNFVAGEVRLYDFFSNMVPASVEFEIGALEPQAYDHYKVLPNEAVQWQYLTNQDARAVSHMHLFRQRIPLRNVVPAAYQ